MAEAKANGHSAQPTSFAQGAGVWIPDPTLEWVSAEVVTDNGENVTVISEEGQETTVPRAKIYLKNPEILEGSDDLAALSYMSEPHILHNLHSRYNLNMIYTYIGKILIAVNPYARIPLYGTNMINAYYGKPIGALSPHVYAIAEDAFKDMRIEGASQSILVSGESGAGKTETTKYILQYFAAMGELLRQTSSPTDHGDDSKTVSIEERVLESTPLLEAVGNAKTLRNDNSSRFGKFIEIHFNEHGEIMGARILTYLLEKSRIVRQVKGERNYHIFYQLLAGASDELREELSLREASSYYYLSQSDCTEVDGVDDAEVFQHTMHAMQVSGMTDQMLHDCWTIVAGVLWLGNIKFSAKDDNAIIEDPEPLDTAARILRVNKTDLELSLLTKKMTTKTDSYVLNLTPEQAENSRDSLAMLLYSQLFEFLVAQINLSLVTKKKPKSFIGILDIYGFECFEKNGFEQFCINFANEKLQQLFNLHVFKEEQQEYIKEKIDWNYVDFADNQDTLDLIEKRPMCVLTLLDEESTFPKATNLTFATKLYGKLSQHPRFEKPRFSNSAFTINHYAGKVTYDTEGFLDKNKDYVIPEQLALLQKSEFPFVKTLIKVLAQQQQGQGSSYKFTSVGAQFATSLGVLMKTIMSTSPHYIRCIKPNPSKEPSLFVKKDVMHQLRCGGVMESVRICCAGFPTRRPLEKFYDRYKILAPRKKLKDVKAQVMEIVNALKLDEDKYKIGLTKIFLRSGQIANLESLRTIKLDSSATMIQKHYRGMNSRRYYLNLRRSAVLLQTTIRRVQSRKMLVGLRRNHAALRIQTCFRRHRARKVYLKQLKYALCLQQVTRAWYAKRELATYRAEAAAITLQTRIRAFFARGQYRWKRRSITLLQARWRSKIARRVYSQLRTEARSLATVQEQKNKLEAKLDEAHWRLQAETRAKAKLETDMEEMRKHVNSASEEKRRLEHEKKAAELQLKEQETKFLHEIGEKNKIVQEQRAKLDQELRAGKEEMQKLIEQLRGENHELSAQLKSAREEIERISKEKSSAIQTNRELTEAMRKLKEENRQLSSDSKELEEEKNEEIKKLEGELEEMKEKMQDTELTLRTTRAELEEELKKLEEEKKNSSSEISTKGSLVLSLEEEVKGLKGVNEKLQEENRGQKESIERLQSGGAELSERMKSEESRLEQEILTRSMKVSELEMALAQKEKENKDFDALVQKLRGSISEMEKEGQNRAQEIAQLGEKNKRDLEKAREDRESLESKLKGEIDSLRKEIYDLKDANIQVKQERDSQIRQIEESNARRLNEKQEKISSLEEQLSALREMKSRFEGELNQDSAYLKEMTTLQESMLKKHQDELDEKRRLAGRLEDERDSLRESLNLIKLELQRSQDANAQIDEQRKQALEKLRERKEQATQTKEKLAQKTAELERAQMEISQGKEKLESVKTKYEGRVEKAKGKAKKLKEANAGLEKELVTLKAQSMFGESAHAKTQSLEAQILASQKELEAKTTELEEATKQIAHLSQEIAKLQSESEPLTKLNHTLQEQLEKKEKELQILSKDREKEESEWVRKIELAREEKEGEMMKLKQALESLNAKWAEEERKRTANEAGTRKTEFAIKKYEKKIQKWKLIEEAANFRESDWEKLARGVGNGPSEAKTLTGFLLSCSENSLFPGQMLFHEVYYWRAIETNNVPMLNAIANTLHETIEMRHDNLEDMVQYLSCIGFLLYILYKSTNQNLEDFVKVPPLRSDQHISLSPKIDRSPRPHITKGIDFVDYLKIVVGKSFSCVLRILAKRMSSVLEGLFLMDSYKSMKVTRNTQQSTPLGVTEVTTLLSDSAITLFQQAFISTTFSQQIFFKVFKYISGYLLNGILLRQQFCCESFGVFLAPKIEALEQWAKKDSIWVGDAYTELAQVKQAAAVLQLKDKSVLVDEKNRRNICPTLSPTQLRQLLAMYSPEEYGKKIPISVINAIVIPKSATQQEQILTELNEVSSFKVAAIHYLEVSDMFQIPIPFVLKTAIEKVCIVQEDEDMDGLVL